MTTEINESSGFDYVDSIYDDETKDGELQGRTVTIVLHENSQYSELFMAAIMDAIIKQYGKSTPDPIEKNIIVKYDFKHKHENKYDKEIHKLEEAMPDKKADPYTYYSYKARIEMLESYRQRDLAAECAYFHWYDAAKHLCKMIEHEKRSQEYQYDARKEYKSLMDSGIPVGPFCIEWIVADAGKGVGLKFGFSF